MDHGHHPTTETSEPALDWAELREEIRRAFDHVTAVAEAHLLVAAARVRIIGEQISRRYGSP